MSPDCAHFVSGEGVGTLAWPHTGSSGCAKSWLMRVARRKARGDRKRVGEGKRVDIGGGRIIKKKSVRGGCGDLGMAAHRVVRVRKVVVDASGAKEGARVARAGVS